MPTAEDQQDGQTLMVTYRIEEGVSNDQARELIQQSTPEGLSISNFESEEPAGS